MHRAVMTICVVLLCLPIFMKSRTSRDKPTNTAFHVLSSGRVIVKVSGDVMYSGVYEVCAKLLANNVINMAVPMHGDKQANRDPSANRPVRNGSSVIFTRKSDGKCLITVGSMTVTERLILGIPLDITDMSEPDFSQLPGIGPVLAKRIVEYRQFNGDILSVKDLASVEGIGEKKIKVIRAMFN